MALGETNSSPLRAEDAPLQPTLRPATQEEIGETLAFALRFNGRRRVQTAEDAMARITAERLVEHLERSGFVVLKRPDQAAPSTSRHRHPNAD